MTRFGRRMFAVVALLSRIALPSFAQDTKKRAVTFSDIIKMHRVAEPNVSPDGRWIAYTLATPDMEANRNASNIWLVPTVGAPPRSSRKVATILPPCGRRMEKCLRFSLRGAAIHKSICFPSKAGKRAH